MAYIVKSIFYSLQGEGVRSGTPAVFCRFSGCNLWSGRERDRAAAVCQFCDTDFVGIDGSRGGSYESADDLAKMVGSAWPSGVDGSPLVVCTGGEPLLQLDKELCAALAAAGFEVAVETNGTRPVPGGVNWVCVSPKAGAKVVVQRADELKLVFPQAGLAPEDFVGFETDRFVLQPRDGEDRNANMALAVEYCLTHPKWRLGLQMHKNLGIE